VVVMSKDGIKLSIVVPVLDEAAGIDAFLAALQPLREPGVELIVADGGSRDDTVQRCVGRVDALVNAARGRARQMNAGAAQAKGRCLLFLHADTRLPGGAVDAVLDAVDGEASATKAWGRFDVSIDGESRMLACIAALMNLRSRLSGIATGDQALFMRREAFDAVGGFPDQALMEDIEISRRLRRLAAPRCLRLRVRTSGRRWEQHGVWRTIGLMWRLRLLYWLGVSPAALARDYR
jgi:rSAM/selenodomain-associated transferase 2